MRPVLLTGLTLSIVTGTLVFTGGAQPSYGGYRFRLKMVLLAITLIFHFTVYRAVSAAPAGGSRGREPGDGRLHAGALVRRRLGRAGRSRFF